jgi:capsular polysaccharide biosynthesis protein
VTITPGPSPARPDRPLKTVGSALRHRRRLAALIVLFLVGLAGLAATVRPPTYQGTAVLFLDERYNSSQGFDLALQAGELMNHHYIQMATHTPVLDAVCSGPDAAIVAPNGPCTPDALADHIRAATVSGTSLVAVTASAPNPTAAATLANDVAQGVIDQDRQQVSQMLKPQSDYLDAELKRLSAAIQAGGSPTQLNVLQGEYATTYKQRQDLAVEEFRLAGNLSLIQRAEPPAEPVDPDPKKYLLAGLVAGTLVAFLIALWLELRDDRLREPGQLAQAAGARFVMSVPASRNGASTSNGLAYAGLLSLHPRLHTVLVTAASAGDRAHAGAEQVAAVAAQAGQRVSIVPAQDYDLEAPSDPLDLLVVAAPSPDTSARAVLLARSSDAAVVVATRGVTRFGDVERTSALLRSAGADVAAAILLPRARPAGFIGKWLHR